MDTRAKQSEPSKKRLLNICPIYLSSALAILRIEIQLTWLTRWALLLRKNISSERILGLFSGIQNNRVMHVARAKSFARTQPQCL
jgi:hypothetical protein